MKRAFIISSAIALLAFVFSCSKPEATIEETKVTLFKEYVKIYDETGEQFLGVTIESASKEQVEEQKAYYENQELVFIHAPSVEALQKRVQASMPEWSMEMELQMKNSPIDDVVEEDIPEVLINYDFSNMPELKMGVGASSFLFKEKKSSSSLKKARAEAHVLEGRNVYLGWDSQSLPDITFVINWSSYWYIGCLCQYHYMDARVSTTASPSLRSKILYEISDGWGIDVPTKGVRIIGITLNSKVQALINLVWLS